MPPGLQTYRELLKALGVQEKFQPRDFIAVLRTLKRNTQGRPLDTNELALAVGEFSEVPYLFKLDLQGDHCWGIQGQQGTHSIAILPS